MHREKFWSSSCRRCFQNRYQYYRILVTGRVIGPVGILEYPFCCCSPIRHCHSWEDKKNHLYCCMVHKTTQIISMFAPQIIDQVPQTKTLRGREDENFNFNEEDVEPMLKCSQQLACILDVASSLKFKCTYSDYLCGVVSSRH